MLQPWLFRSTGAVRYHCSRCLRLRDQQLRISAAQRSSRHSIRCVQTSSAAAADSQNPIPLRKQLKEEAKALKARKREKKETEEASRRGWELTVGIEIHAQLNTQSKLFSSKTAPFPLWKNTCLIVVKELQPQPATYPTPTSLCLIWHFQAASRSVIQETHHLI